MPIQIQWDNPEKTTILCTFTNPWEWTDFDGLIATTDEMFLEAGHTVDLLFDFTASSHMPSNALNYFRSLSRRETPLLGMMVMVKVSALMQLIGDILDRLYPRVTQKVRPVRTLEEARKILADIQAGRAPSVTKP